MYLSAPIAFLLATSRFNPLKCELMAAVIALKMDKTFEAAAAIGKINVLDG